MNPHPPPAAIEVTDLTYEYGTGEGTVRPLDGFAMQVPDGQLAVLLGPSGCGKSTLLSIIGGLRSATSGRIVVAGQEVTALGGADLDAYRRDTVGFVFQSFNLIPSLTAAENVATPLLARGVRRRAAMGRAEAALDEVGLSDRAGHRPRSLSGGQQQRVAVARGLVTDAPVIVADEPTANLDHLAAEATIRLFRQISGGGRTVLVATHDSRFSPIADLVVDMVPDLSHSPDPPVAVTFPAGETLFWQGSRGDRVYVLSTGEVDVLRQLPDGREELIRTIAAPGHVGELGPLLGFPRSATVRARTDVAATHYSAADFRELVAGDVPST